MRKIKKIVTTSNAPGAIGPYSQAIVANGCIYTSGQLPISPTTGVMSEGIAEQTRQSLNNVRAILEEAGTSIEQVVKSTVYLKDMNDFAVMNEVYSTFFKESNYPARSAVQVAKLPKDALVEIEVIAVI